MTRRGFSAVAAAGAMSSASAASAKICVAMIGSGHGHAASKIKALQSMPEYEFVGLCRPDADDPAVGDIFSKVPSLKLDEVLKDKSVTLVAAESADAERNLKYARMAVDAGKYVHLDKPPGANLPKLAELLDIAASKKLIVQMGYQWRYQPAMQAAIEAAHKGWLGRVHRFRAFIDKPIDVEERRHLAKYKGGMMFSEGCHLVDRATAALGKPERVTGFIRHHAPLQDGLADNSMLVLEYPAALAEISLAAFDPQGGEHRLLEIKGTNGTALVQPYTSNRLYLELKDAAGPYAAGKQIIETKNPPGLAYTPDFREMAAIIQHGAKPSYTPEHDLMTHRVLLEGCGML